MQEGIVKSLDKSCGIGTIGCPCEDDIRFYMESVIGKERAGLQQGDRVSFDVGNIKNLRIAVNVRKGA